MRLIPDDHLALMRAFNDDNLPHMVHVEIKPVTRGDGGTNVEGDWTEVGSAPCRLQPVVKAFRTVDLVVTAAQLREKAYWLVITDVSFDIDHTQHTRFKVVGDDWTRYLDVLGTTGPHTAESMRKWVCTSHAA